YLLYFPRHLISFVLGLSNMGPFLNHLLFLHLDNFTILVARLISNCYNSLVETLNLELYEDV
ncbi:MAG: hypothetical protein ACLBM1_08980, partial [Cuspidothrix sp.]